MLWISIVALGVVLMIGALTALHAATWVWIVVLIVGASVVIVGLLMAIKPAQKQDVREIALGTYLISTKRVHVQVHEGSGASVWPAPWWAPWRHDAIHVAKIEEGEKS